METTQEAPMSFDRLRAIYYRQLGKRASYALDAKVKRGEWIGYAPTGYKNVSGTVEIDPALAPLIDEAFRLIARQRSSLRQVITELTPRGLVSRTGKPFGVSALRALILNPFYLGMIRYKGKILQGNHPALVSPSLFERAGRSLRRRRK